MKFYAKNFFIFLILFILAMAAGCAHVSMEEQAMSIVATSEAFKNFTGEYQNTPYFKKHKPVSVAVLPFHYSGTKSYSIEVEQENPARIVRRGMYNHISSLPFSDLEIFNTDRRLHNAGFKDPDKFETLITENPRKLKSILGVDAAITGEVTHFDRIFLGIYSQVAVGCEVKMWDLKTGNLLWRAKQVSRAHAGGLSINPIGLVVATVASVWNLRGTEMLSQTDELFREVVFTIELPESLLKVQQPPPRIDLFAAMNTGRPFTLGRKVAFRIIGDPQCSAYVDLGDFKSSIPLAPVPDNVKQALHAEVLEVIKKNYEDTGHTLTPEFIAAVKQELTSREIYEGTYTVEAKEEAYGLIPKAYLVNSAGAQKTAIDAVHSVDIDSFPPQTSAGLSSESLDGKVRLYWAPNSEKDLTGYEIWSSPTPLSGYTFISKSEKNEFIIEGLPNFAKIYFQVRAMDRANNKSNFSRHLQAVPLPEPGLYDLPQPGPVLGGKVKEKILLVAEKNPYSVQSDLEIISGGVVYLEPGVKIEFAPDTSLLVTKGDFLAYGRKDKPIYLTPKAAAREPGAWRGVVLDGSERSMLRHVIIEYAATGLTIINSAPLITNSKVTGSSQAGLYLKDMARPNISCSEFTGNEGQGGVIIEGKGVSPIVRNNVFADNSPFQVQSYTPLKINLSNNYWGLSEPRPDWFLGDIVWKPALSMPPNFCSEK